jgi:hypothetical protein
MGYAQSVCAVGYDALTDYRNSWGEGGQVGKLGKLLAEPLYLGLVVVGVVETTARAVCAFVIRGVFFVGCHIPSHWVDSHLDDVQNAYEWVRDSALSCGKATGASALSLKNNLYADLLDAGAQMLTVKAYAEKHLVSDVDINHIDKCAFARPFMLPLLKAVTEWRNDFIDTKTREIVRSTKVFKQICAVPLYLGVAAVSTCETLARLAYSVSLIALGLMIVCSVGITSVVKYVWGNIVPNQYGDRLITDITWLALDHQFGTSGSAVYSFTVMGAALLSLKDNFIKNADRVFEFGQMHNKKQIDQVMKACVTLAVGVGNFLTTVLPPVFESLLMMTEMAVKTFSYGIGFILVGFFKCEILKLGVGIVQVIGSPIAGITFGIYCLGEKFFDGGAGIALRAGQRALAAGKPYLSECFSLDSYY